MVHGLASEGRSDPRPMTFRLVDVDVQIGRCLAADRDARSNQPARGRKYENNTYLRTRAVVDFSCTPLASDLRGQHPLLGFPGATTGPVARMHAPDVVSKSISSRSLNTGRETRVIRSLLHCMLCHLFPSAAFTT